jgi:hypothetical protein
MAARAAPVVSLVAVNSSEAFTTTEYDVSAVLSVHSPSPCRNTIVSAGATIEAAVV